jgi:hypothetical protein
MERVVPCAELVQLVSPHAPEGSKGRPPFPIETVLRVHFMQQWSTLSAPWRWKRRITTSPYTASSLVWLGQPHPRRDHHPAVPCCRTTS